ncbi:MAG: hypothetical protein WBN19_11060, partial [Lutimonas sp.]
MKAFFLILFLCVQSVSAQQSVVKDIKKFQKKLNEDFMNSAKSPLTEADLANFNELSFFPIDTTYVVKAKIE